MRKTAFAAAAAVALLAPHVAYGQTGAPNVGSLLGTVTGTAGGAVTGVGNAVGGVGGTIGGGVGGAIGGVGGAIGGIGGAVGGGGGGVGGIGGLGGGAAGGGAGFGGASPAPAVTGSLATGIGSGPGSTVGSVASISLPAALAPCDDQARRRETARISPCGPRYTAYFPDVGSVRGTREDLESFRTPLQPRSGTPQQVVQDCRAAIVAAALPYGVVRVDAASAGPMRSARGGFAAPVEFRIVYNRQGGLETRQATINCRMNTAGRVISAA
jgi:hypothetical protein